MSQLQIKKLPRLQLLREEALVSECIYKVNNQLRQWPVLRKLKYVISKVKKAVSTHKYLDKMVIENLKQDLIQLGMEVRYYIQESYLLPIMSVFYASVS